MEPDYRRVRDGRRAGREWYARPAARELLRVRARAHTTLTRLVFDSARGVVAAGPQAMAFGCAGFAAFSAAIDALGFGQFD